MTSDEQCSMHWDRVYSTKPADAVSWYEERPDISIRTISECTVPLSAPVIDVGGGLSPLAYSLLASGYSDVTVLDISRAAMERQKESLGISTIVADVTQWQPQRRYAIWHDRAVLHFLVNEEQRAGYRRALLAAISVGGYAAIATFSPTGPTHCSGLSVRRYSATDITEFLGSPFLVEDAFQFDHTTPSGAQQCFQLVRARRVCS